MQPPIEIQKEGNHLNVSFSYNKDLVDIMRELEGWWMNKKKCWMFPTSMLSRVREKLVSEGYKVNILKEKEQEKIKDNFEDRFNDPDVIGVYGNCSVCGGYESLNKEKKCRKCLLK